MSHQDETVRTLRTSIESGQMQHLLFYGPPGTGKTSTILALARDMFGADLPKTRVMELNASDERGIDVVRRKIKGFAQAAVPRGGPTFKLLILDEADSLTQDAQAALRRTMERYSRVTRFCFICNYVSRIIEPLASRCAKFRFKPLDTESMNSRLQHIADSEGVRVTPEVLETVRQVSGGDLRKAITYLQSASQLYGSALTPEYIVEIAGVLPPADSDRLWKAIREPRFDDLRPVVTQLNAQGYALAAMLDKLCDLVLADGTLSDTQKADMAMALAECDKCVADGAEEELQLFALAARLQQVARVAA